MPDRGPLKLTDLKMGDHIIWFTRNQDDSNQVVQTLLDYGNGKGETSLYLSTDCMERLGIQSVDDVINYIHDQADQTRSRNSNGHRVIIDIGTIIRRITEKAEYFYQLRKLGAGFSDAFCQTVWLVDTSCLEQRVAVHIIHTQSWLGIDGTIYKNRYCIPSLRIRSENEDPDHLYHWIEDTLIHYPQEIDTGCGDGQRIAQADDQTKGRLSDLTLIRSLFDAATLGIVIVDMYGRIQDNNPAFAGMIGYNQDELLGRKIVSFCAAEDLQLEQDLLKILQGDGRSNLQVERRFIARDGQSVCGRLNISLLVEPYGNPHGMLILMEDITTRRQLEDELIEVQRRLMQNREMERLRLAQDLHDSTLQDLYGLGFSLKELIDSVKDPEILEKLQMVQNHLIQQIQDLRLFCNELRPPTLVPFGLEKAIRSHSQNFQLNHSNLKFELDLMTDGQQLPEPVRLALFRIYQEVVNNVARHSGASIVSIRFQLLPDQVELEIIDNGQGFEIPDRWVNLARQGHFGLVGALERAETVGGKMSIWSQPGKGTKVNIVVPANLTFEKA